MFDDGVLNYAIKAIDKDQYDTLKNMVIGLSDPKISETLSCRDKHGRTPLYASIEIGNLHCFKYLLKTCNVDPTVKNWHKDYRLCTPLNMAVYQGYVPMVKMLLEDERIVLNNYADPNYVSPLVVAVTGVPTEIARLLISKGEDIDRSRCLIIAIDNGISNRLIKHILECGADVNLKLPSGWTAVHSCCSHGNLEILTILIDKGADQHVIYRGSILPIDMAGLKGAENIVSFYLKKNTYPRERVYNSVELLGVESVVRSEISLAIRFWNSALKQRANSENPTYSWFLRELPANSKPIVNYNHLIGNKGRASIHAINILERIFGCEHYYFFRYSIELMDNVPLENRHVREVLLFTRSLFFCNFLCERFSRRFNPYAAIVSSKKKAPTVFNTVVIKVLDLSFEILFSPYTDRSEVNQCLNCCLGCYMFLCSLKKTMSIDEKRVYHRILQKFPHVIKFIDPSLFHISDKEGGPYVPFHEVLEVYGKVFESINFINALNETPLYLSLRTFDAKAVEVLLENGALRDTRTKYDETIRELAIEHGAEKIYTGAVSLQILIVSGLKQDRIRVNKDRPLILNYFFILH